MACAAVGVGNMDRARDMHFVNQMPRRTIDDVVAQEAACDRQTELTESWSAFCTRTGRSLAVAAEEHSKFSTESWSEYEARAVERAAHMAQFDADQSAVRTSMEHAQAQRKAKAAQLVGALTERDRAYRKSRLPPIHTLCLDFDDLRAEREARERAGVEDAEASARESATRDEGAARTGARQQFAAELNALLATLETRRLAQELEAQRQREETQRREEAARAAEERRRKEAEEADRKRREAEEEAKRAERRKKDEERRARAKAERDARAGKKADVPAAQAAAEPTGSPTTAAPVDSASTPPSTAE